jgi:uncharacterized protein YjbI with pentapeptide repeats
LEQALLGEANLTSADLRGADLTGAHLTGAKLMDADLTKADLAGVKGIGNKELHQQATSLKGATMPNDQKYEDWLKDIRGPIGEER